MDALRQVRLLVCFLMVDLASTKRAHGIHLNRQLYVDDGVFAATWICIVSTARGRM